jgi:hypothetical protein
MLSFLRWNHCVECVVFCTLVLRNVEVGVLVSSTVVVTATTTTTTITATTTEVNCWDITS